MGKKLEQSFQAATKINLQVWPTTEIKNVPIMELSGKTEEIHLEI